MLLILSILWLAAMLMGLAILKVFGNNTRDYEAQTKRERSDDI